MNRTTDLPPGLLLFLILLLALQGGAAASMRAGPDSLFAETDSLFNRIYSCRVDRPRAAAALARIRLLLSRTERSASSLRRFPLRGYSFRQFDDGRGRGYVGAEAFDFLDGNRHKGHPALDLFVYDRNRDCLDDRTGKPVVVAAVTQGIVLCTFAAWDTTSVDSRGGILRGGNQVWLYSPADDGIWYYAHLGSVSVKAGDRVEAGTPLGTAGRTGVNARMQRSPTHLHLMFLRWSGEGLRPENPYGFLRRSP